MKNIMHPLPKCQFTDLKDIVEKDPLGLSGIIGPPILQTWDHVGASYIQKAIDTCPLCLFTLYYNSPYLFLALIMLYSQSIVERVNELMVNKTENVQPMDIDMLFEGFLRFYSGVMTMNAAMGNPSLSEETLSNIMDSGES